jgi:uncharacterized lipoprotein YmbA
MSSRRLLAPLAVLAIAGATGCLSRPALVSQSFSIDPPAARAAPPPCGLVLSLSRVEVEAPYSGRMLVYRTADHVVERDPYSRFAAPPATLLTTAIRGSLANAGFVRDVVRAGDGTRADAVLEVTVTDLAGELRPSGSSAILALRVRGRRVGGGAPPAEPFLKTYSKARAIPRAAAADVVDGWHQSLAEIVAELAADLRGYLAVSRDACAATVTAQ